jgi:hypothetical protein
MHRLQQVAKLRLSCATKFVFLEVVVSQKRLETIGSGKIAFQIGVDVPDCQFSHERFQGETSKKMLMTGRNYWWRLPMSDNGFLTYFAVSDQK